MNLFRVLIDSSERFSDVGAAILETDESVIVHLSGSITTISVRRRCDRPSDGVQAVVPVLGREDRGGLSKGGDGGTSGMTTTWPGDTLASGVAST